MNSFAKGHKPNLGDQKNHWLWNINCVICLPPCVFWKILLKRKGKFKKQMLQCSITYKEGDYEFLREWFFSTFSYVVYQTIYIATPIFETKIQIYKVCVTHWECLQLTECSRRGSSRYADCLFNELYKTVYVLVTLTGYSKFVYLWQRQDIALQYMSWNVAPRLQHQHTIMFE